jgi:hypothetical protein
MAFPTAPYLYCSDTPHVGPHRPLSQGDVFLGIPLVAGAQPDPKQPGTWRARARTGPKALGLFVTHPCASRSSATYKLHPFVSIAPVVKCPSNWGPPWGGHYDLVPLPGLISGQDYVAKLGETCPVPTEALEGRRVAALNKEGLEALFHRLAMNSLRFPETPMHYITEAARVTNEINLWERWTAHHDTEDGFQAWLDEPFEGQPREDAEGNVIDGSQQTTGEQRRSVLVWNYSELLDELETSLSPP